MGMRKPRAPLVDNNFVQVDFCPEPFTNTNKNQDFQQFMKSKISKLSSALLVRKEEDDRDEDDDNELDSLLKSSKLLEEIRVEELSGRERRQYLDDNLKKFGGKKLKQKVSLPMHLGMKKAATKRIDRKVEDLRNNGIYSTKMKNELIAKEASLNKSKKGVVKVDRGLFGSMGKMRKNGVMTVSKRVIESVSKPSGPKKRSGNRNPAYLRNL